MMSISLKCLKLIQLYSLFNYDLNLIYGQSNNSY